MICLNKTYIAGLKTNVDSLFVVDFKVGHQQNVAHEISRLYDYRYFAIYHHC